MTARLYYRDSYVREFRAQVTGLSPDRCTVYLDQTAFYPTSGGQPHDLGLLGGTAVAGVVDEGERIAHVLSAPWNGSSRDVLCEVDWARRFDHMQQHTGQHLLSAVFAEALGADTVSFHLGERFSTIDVASGQLDATDLRRVEERANAVVFENRQVSIGFEDAASAAELRKPSERDGEIRIVTIEGLDRSGCGGTHVRATGEIGPILLGGVEKIRGNTRIEFVCGLRAVRRARTDHDLLTVLSRQFSAPPGDLTSLTAAQRERLEESEKARRRLGLELAEQRGHRAYEETQPGAGGIRRHRRRAATLTDEIRAEALSFTSRPAALFLALGENPPALLLASSEGSAVHAGDWLKAALKETGGRGGGNARLAQGSVPDAALLDRIALRLGE